MRLNSNIQNHDHNQNLFSLPQTNHTFKKLLFTYAPNLLFFFRDVEKFGFKLNWKNLKNQCFLFFDFKKIRDAKSKKKLPNISLKACVYKKRWWLRRIVSSSCNKFLFWSLLYLVYKAPSNQPQWYGGIYRLRWEFIKENKKGRKQEERKKELDQESD